jgi:hypothetical protein
LVSQSAAAWPLAEVSLLRPALALVSRSAEVSLSQSPAASPSAEVSPSQFASAYPSRSLSVYSWASESVCSLESRSVLPWPWPLWSASS